MQGEGVAHRLPLQCVQQQLGREIRQQMCGQFPACWPRRTVAARASHSWRWLLAKVAAISGWRVSSARISVPSSRFSGVSDQAR